MRKHCRGKATVKDALLWVILLTMPVRSVAAPHASRQVQTNRVTENARVLAALEWFSPNIGWINGQQARITEIPAPPFHEGERAEAVRASLVEAGLEVQVDKTGNVIGELRGVNEKEIVVVAAHMDTVFPSGTAVKVRRNGSRMEAPGISDNGTGVAALLAFARAAQAAQLKPLRTILFVGDVGEEGEGNLRGMRAIVDAYRSRIKAVVVLDGSGTEHVTTKALASRRLEAVVSGPGGHSWSDFGMANPINALVRGSVRFINTYRVDLASPEGQKFMLKQCAIYFGYEEGDLAQTAYVPAEPKKSSE